MLLFLLVATTTITHKSAGVVQALVAFRTERVVTVERVLDVHVFRRWSVSVEHYMSQNPTASRDEAWETLTQRLQVNDPAVQFVAIVVVEEEEEEDIRFAITHGVVGAVDVTPTSDTSVYLKNLRVDERVRRQGIASALIRDVLEYAYPRT
eukprot:scaffold35276_cov160-Amphora_coffeaeformis.AAC.1